MTSHHWFRKLIATVRQQAITWANDDPDLCCHMASLGHNKLIWITSAISLQIQNLYCINNLLPRKVGLLWQTINKHNLTKNLTKSKLYRLNHKIKYIKHEKWTITHTQRLAGSIVMWTSLWQGSSSNKTMVQSLHSEGTQGCHSKYM